jgi:transcriptional regulator with XRE-family HTH domain
MEDLKEKLKEYMAAKDITLEAVAAKIGRNPKTVWRFLHDYPMHFRTLYRIRRLVGKNQ